MIIIINPQEGSFKRRSWTGTTYKAEPKLHSSGRRTSRGVFFKEPIVCAVNSKEKDSYEVTLVNGTGHLYDRSPNNSQPVSRLKFWISFEQMKSTEIITGDLADSVHSKITEQGHLLGKQYLVPFNDVLRIEIPRSISIKHMIENNGSHLVLEFPSGMHNPMDLKEAERTDDTQFQAICRKLATTFGLETNMNTREEGDDVVITNVREFNFYRHLSGVMIVKESDFENFKKDILEAVAKYHVPLVSSDVEVEDYEDLRTFSLDEHSAQEALVNNGIEVKDALTEQRGFVHGRKMGL